MDRLNLLRGSIGPSSPLEESGSSDAGYRTAADTSTKYFSCSDSETEGGPTPSKTTTRPADESTPNHSAPPGNDGQDSLISKLSPITKTDAGLGGAIDAANILSGGVDIFDENSYDDDELVIDDNATCDSNDESKSNDVTLAHTKPTEKVICEPIESANMALSIDDHLTLKEMSDPKDMDPCSSQDSVDSRMEEATESLDSSVSSNEVILQIDGKNVDAIDIGNGLYLYRKDEGEDLMAIQILHDGDQQPQFKFLKVRQNDDGNLEVYEEQILEVPLTDEELEEEKRKGKKEKDKQSVKQKSHLPIKDLDKVINQEASGKTTTLTVNAPSKEDLTNKSEITDEKIKAEAGKKLQADTKLKPNPLKNLEGSRKSPILGNFTSMTIHSAPNREGVPLTKTMVNLQLNPSRHSDTVKKTIEVSTDHNKSKSSEKSIATLVEPVEDKKSEEIKISLVTDDVQEIGKYIVVQDSDKVSADVEENTDHPSIKPQLPQSSTKFVCQNEFKNNNTLNKPHNVEDIKEIHELNEHKEDHNKILIQGKSDLTMQPVEILGHHAKDKLNIANLKQDVDNEGKMGATDQSLNSETLNITSNVSVTANKILHKDAIDASKEKTSEKSVGIQNIDNDNKKTIATPLVETDDSAGSKSQNVTMSSVTQSNNKYIPSDKNTKVSDDGVSKEDNAKNIKSEKANIFEDNKFMNKYISEALGMKNITASTIESLKSDRNLKLSPELELKAKPKPLEKSPPSESTLFVNVDSSKKPVPFGKWTEADKKGYLNKLKDHKLPTSNPCLNPVKSYQLASNKNDMKRLELKKKVDSFEKVHLSNALAVTNTNQVKFEKQSESGENSKDVKNSSVPRSDINAQELINKTIEGIIMETLFAGPSDRLTLPKSSTSKEQIKPEAKDPNKKGISTQVKLPQSSTLDDIERQMNELHGIPFVEKLNSDTLGNVILSASSKSLDNTCLKIDTSHSKIPQASKVTKMPKLLPLNSGSIKACDKGRDTGLNQDEDDQSEDEILDCEPVTGDSEVHRSESSFKIKTQKDVLEQKLKNASVSKMNFRGTKEDQQPITEMEFDKFVRRNSRDSSLKSEVNKSRNSLRSIDTKYQRSTKLYNTSARPILHAPKAIYPGKNETNLPVESLNVYSLQANDVGQSRSYNTKLQMAYQSAVTAMRKEPPDKIIEDKTVKVVFMESNTKYLTKQNVQLGEIIESTSSCGSIASDTDEGKIAEMATIKVKQPRKQVLTPVESPELEIIEPGNIDNDNSLKKKRKIEHKKRESDILGKKDFKSMLPKKNYLLGRAISITEESTKHDDDCKTKHITEETKNSSNKSRNLEANPKSPSENVKIPSINSKNPSDEVNRPNKPDKSMADLNLLNNLKNTLNKSKNYFDKSTADADAVQETPSKRGRGRPRKHTAQDTPDVDQKSVAPKKPKLSESDKNSITSSDDDSDDEGIPRENWTMGKIDEKIVCPICKKLFRSENVVFKHVKHCSSLSMSPSKRKLDHDDVLCRMKRTRTEYNSYKETLEPNDTRMIHKPSISENTKEKSDENLLNKQQSNAVTLEPKENESKIISMISPKPDEVILIEDSPAATTFSKSDKEIVKIMPKNKVGRPRSNHSMTCEICGKSFRQLSYLVNHRAVHNKEAPKRRASVNSVVEIKVGVFSCEVCGKDFRKLHHLVQHREIHCARASAGLQRKVSTEVRQKEEKLSKEKPAEHPAGFRCEPCDKSFRKLHHLVEHRETHGVNRLKNSPPNQVVLPEKSVTVSPMCDVCGKSFRKLHHLIEHREQHVDVSKSEKKETQERNEKKPTLLAKDIIHECALCYMVFPNEPSLNKHFVICQRKKKPSAVKKSTDVSDQIEPAKGEIDEDIAKETSEIENVLIENVPVLLPSTADDVKLAVSLPEMRASKEIMSEIVPIIPENVKKLDPDTPKLTPKNKITKPAKIGATVTKHSAESQLPLPIVEEVAANALKSNDSEDDIRYMLNPLYDQESEEEREIFMNVRHAKRNSLQFDSPKKDSLKPRRTSLQYTSKLQRMVPKRTDKLSKPPIQPSEPELPKAKPLKLQKRKASLPFASIAEDNDIKYSFPKSVKTEKPKRKSSVAKNEETKTNVETVPVSKRSDKRKSLTGIAKRKSAGKSIAMKPKSNSVKDMEQLAPKKVVRKQMSVPHVCDCGKPFNSAALLARHTSLDHTPPRIRKSRNPTPDLVSNTPKAGKIKVLVTKKIPHSGVPAPVKPDFFKKLRRE